MVDVIHAASPDYTVNATEVDPLLENGLKNDDLATTIEGDVCDPRVRTGDEQTVNNLGSMVFVVNQIYGIGLLALPMVFQQVGIWVMTAMLVFFTALSSFACTMLTDAMALIPGNERFQKRIEYANLTHILFGPKFYVVQQICYNLAMQSLNIASIVVTAQPVDSLFIFIFGKTWAWVFYPQFTVTQVTSINDLYGDKNFMIAISLGYLIVMGVFLPLGFLDLNINIMIQYGAFFITAILLGEFSWHFVHKGLHPDAVPNFGTTYTQIISIFILSYAYPMLIPSWVNVKKTYVSVNLIIWLSGLSAFVGYMLIGLLGAMAYPKLSSDDIIKEMSNEQTELITRISIYAFIVAIVATSIPVYSICVRYNLYVGKLCGRKTSIFLGVIAPWLVGFLFCRGQAFAQFLNWTSLFLNGIENFIIPILCYYKAQSNYVMENKRPGSYVNALLVPWLLRSWKSFTLTLLILTIGLMTLQALMSLYYLIVLHENILDQ
jgi:amino acid permease